MPWASRLDLALKSKDRPADGASTAVLLLLSEFDPIDHAVKASEGVWSANSDPTPAQRRYARLIAQQITLVPMMCRAPQTADIKEKAAKVFFNNPDRTFSSRQSVWPLPYPRPTRLPIPTARTGHDRGSRIELSAFDRPPDPLHARQGAGWSRFGVSWKFPTAAVNT